jgi:hypothetical protein
LALLAGVALLVSALVLVVAATSVTLLVMARVLESQADIGLRLMLGASVWRVARLWAVEVAVLAGAGSIVGIVLAAWLAHLAVGYVSSVSGVSLSALDTTPDWRVVIYVVLLTAIAVTGIVAIIAGQLSRLNALASTSGAMGMGGATARIVGSRGRLIATQVAIATALLLTAAFLMRSVGSEWHIDPGFESTSIAVAWIDQSGGDRVRQNNRRVLETAQETPGITHAALATRLFSSWSARIRSDAATTHLVQPMGITEEFFEVLRMPVTRGRNISAGDDQRAAAVALVSERTAAALWPGLDPVGRRFWFDAGSKDGVDVIGVVPGIKYRDDNVRSKLDVYLPFNQYALRGWPILSTAMVARGRGPAESVLAGIRSAVGRSVPEAGFRATRTMQEELTGDTASTELFAKALTTLGLVGLLMAVCGLYGLTAHLAALRGREFGIKKALGATNLLLSRTVAVEGLPALLKGLGAGTLIGILAGFWLRSRQFHTLQPFDAIPLLAVGGVLLVAGLAGNLLPFRRLLQREASDLLKEP